MTLKNWVSRTAAASAALASVLVLPGPAFAQSAAEVVDRMLSEYARQSEGIENYSLVQETMGIEALAYFEKETVDGRPVFRLRSSSAGGLNIGGGGGMGGELYELGDELSRRAVHEGVQSLEGRDVHVLMLDDVQDLGFDQEVGPGSEFVPTSARVFVDAEFYVPVRLEFEGVLTDERGEHPVTSLVDFSEYRDVGGMLFAYHTTLTIQGLGAAIDPAMRAEFERMQRELERMPPEQRRMLESMMAGQLEGFRAMMEDESAPMQVEIRIVDVRVNEGPPSN